MRKHPYLLYNKNCLTSQACTCAGGWKYYQQSPCCTCCISQAHVTHVGSDLTMCGWCVRQSQRCTAFTSATSHCHLHGPCSSCAQPACGKYPSNHVMMTRVYNLVCPVLHAGCRLDVLGTINLPKMRSWFVFKQLLRVITVTFWVNCY